MVESVLDQAYSPKFNADRDSGAFRSSGASINYKSEVSINDEMDFGSRDDSETRDATVVNLVQIATQFDVGFEFQYQRRQI